MTSVINSIPRTNQTDPAMFKDYKHQEYPKIMMRLTTKDDIEAWLEANHTIDDKGKKSFKGGRPRIGAPIAMLDDDGKPVVVNDADEEQVFRGGHPNAIETFTVDSEKVSKLQDENAALKAKLAEFEAEKDDDGAAKIANLASGDLPTTLKAEKANKK